MEKGSIDDIWTFQTVGTPFPSNVVKAPGETNKYVALWYKHGKPVMGRAWNDSGVVQCTFVLDDKVYTGPDVGGMIQLLVLDPSDKKRTFSYEWMPYRQAKSLSKEGSCEIVRCQHSVPGYSVEQGLLGSVNTEKLTAQFVDNELKLKTSKQVEDLLVLVKVSRKETPEKEKSSTNLSINSRLATIVNDWEDFNWGGAWPSNKSLMSAPKSGSDPEQFVALWYHHGKPVMGRAWSENGKIEASFVDANREFTGPNVGSLQLLICSPPTTVGYEYDWMEYAKAIDYRDKDFVPVHLSYNCPALVPVGGGHLVLGQVNLKTERASVAHKGKVTQLEGGPVKSISVLCRREMAETMLI